MPRSYNVGDMNGRSGSGFSGSLILTDRKPERHDIPKQIWDFMETVPFYRMSPRQDLRDRGYLLAEVGKAYLAYLPTGGRVNLAVDAAGKPYRVTWINARHPLGDQRPAKTTRDGTNLTAPDAQDWLAYVRR